MIKHTIVIICFFCLIFGFSYGDVSRSKLESQILNQVSRKVVRRHPMFQDSTGNTGYEIAFVGIGYTYSKEVNVEQAREIYVDIAEEFIHAFNSNANKKIRPFLKDYPFSAKNLSLNLMFYNDQKDLPRNGNLAYVIADTHGNLSYHRCVNAKGFDTEEVHFESYKDALKIVQMKNSH